MSDYPTDAESLKAEALLDEIEQIHIAFSEWMETRDRLIREGLESGLLTAPQIAARTGMSRQRIYQIRDGRR